MTLNDIVRKVKTELGSPVVTLYIKDDMIQELVDNAIRKCYSKYYKPKLITLSNVGGVCTLPDYVDTVLNVYPASSRNNADYTVGGLPVLNSGFTSNLGDYLGIMARLRVESELEALMISDFYQDEGLLYLDDYPGNVSIKYLVKDPVIGDIDNAWYGWVVSYTVALTKMTEGRIRGKFKPNNSPFETDADTLVSEGQSERDTLEQQLMDSMGFVTVVK